MIVPFVARSWGVDFLVSIMAFWAGSRLTLITIGCEFDIPLSLDIYKSLSH